MADQIPRDVSEPFDPNDPVQIAELNGFGATVPKSDELIEAAQLILAGTPPAVPDAAFVRTQKLLDPELLRGLVPGDDDLPTPDRVPADRSFFRDGAHGVRRFVPLRGGGNWARIDFLSFKDNQNANSWPAPIIRVREGEVVHTRMNSGMGPHTIHHHGIEPTPMNDGVGHLTFEVGADGYEYQWYAAEAGTYFYHCHRNTVLHFERGMYGPLVIDPPQGPGWVYRENTPVQYDAEVLWVPDDLDTRWHGVDKDEAGNTINYGSGPDGRRREVIGESDVAVGIQPPAPVGGPIPFTRIGDSKNPRLHDFNPNVFVVTGQFAPWDPDPSLVDDRMDGVGAVVNRGQRLLIRALNAAYSHTRWKFPEELSGALVIAADGRTFGKAPFGRYSSPFTLGSIGNRFLLSVAQRWDILVDTSALPARAEPYDVEVSFHSHLTDRRFKTLKLPIRVNP